MKARRLITLVLALLLALSCVGAMAEFKPTPIGEIGDATDQLVARLDADTTGLLLFSTDGELGNALLHPSRHVSKTYLARLKRPLSPDGARLLREGVLLDDGPAQPAEIECADAEWKLVRITVHEGRYHQVKRMFEAVGNAVATLHRESFGPLSLGGLKPGAWRMLTDEEVASLTSGGGGTADGEEGQP